LSEFELIKKIKKLFGKIPPSVKISIGDDAAAVEEDKLKLYTTDMFIENIHFKREYMNPSQIAKKALICSVSDICAMGGVPKYVLLNLALPKEEISFFDEFLEGIKEFLKDHNLYLLGGDLSSSLKDIFICVTVIGEVEKNKVIGRRGAKIGDKIFVTGYLGNSSAGLELLKRGIKINSNLINSHIHPPLRIREAQFIKDYEFATSMIDISDGLILDLYFLLCEDNLGAKIYKDKLPISSDLRSLSSFLSKDIYEYVLYGGEDYELLFTVKKEKYEEFKDIIEKKRKMVAFEIGEIIEEEGIFLVEKSKISKILVKGFNHFSD